MSLDYQNRADWLKVRAERNLKRQPNYVHISIWSERREEIGKPVQVLWFSRTLNQGVNKLKRLSLKARGIRQMVLDQRRMRQLGHA